ncbi:formimidoylglutamase [Gordonia sihwensis]|nr:formimidoylglutamase [Gordonia sihwensis]WFN93158.1 formimidoylglutamase [Gordonia sihwensis]
MSMTGLVDVTPEPWSGRDDGPGAEHVRWHHVVRPLVADDPPAADSPAPTTIVGFASDEGVRRNKGRTGAATGPGALRRALAPMALSGPINVFDAGDVAVTDGELEAGQERLGRVVGTLLDAGHLPLVLGGGHAVAYGSFLGLARSRAAQAGARLGVLNLDAHFDLRPDPVPSSGTPFRQIAEHERARGAQFRYAVLGISQPSNTRVLFDTADALGVRYLFDDACSVADFAVVDRFVDAFLDDVDLLYLTIDLDVLPAAVAPGVSAPAAYGVPVETVQRVCDRVARSGRLALCDVAELNPALDIDGRTARTAARLLHRIVTARA